MIRPDLIRRLLVVVSLVLIAPTLGVAQATDPQLLLLRRQLALSYAEPAAHMALAKYFWQKGNRLQAFYLMEYARRSMFPKPKFKGASKGASTGPPPQTKRKKAVTVFN